MDNELGVNGIIKGTSVKENCNNNPLNDLEYNENFKESESTQKLILTPESPNDERNTWALMSPVMQKITFDYR